MGNICRYKNCVLVLLLLLSGVVHAQRDILRDIQSKIPTGGQTSSGSGDSLKRRDRSEDSLTLRIYFLDSSFAYRPDSSVSDYTLRFPLPADHVSLGNTGAASRSLLFRPAAGPGFDPGFHAFDVYRWRPERVRFYNSTRPFTELGYTLASRAEQIIEILHTQNLKPEWNASFQYRLISAPGFFRNQKTNHNNYVFTSWYQSVSKRYNNYFVLLGNSLQAGESGGIRNDKDYLNDPVYADDRFTIPTKIGGRPAYGTSFFSNFLATGNKYREFNLMLRQQYDLGRKDSLVTDTTVIPLFFPRFRFEHTFRFGNQTFHYRDVPAFTSDQQNEPEAVYYKANYGFVIRREHGFIVQDKWREISNDFSLYQFPDPKNLHQFFKVGAELQLLKGSFLKRDILQSGFPDSVWRPSWRRETEASLYNVIGHAEYRNRTRNRKWDMLAFAKLYFNGYNAADYKAYVSLQRLVSESIGSLMVGFENINRSPSFVFDARSAFYFDPVKNFNKENTTHFFASLVQPRSQMTITADYYLISNYLYLDGFRSLQQEGTLFNVLRVGASRTVRLGRRINWHGEAHLQQKTGTVRLNMPLVYTRHRVAYEGNLGFRNLLIAMGLEGRYHTPYKADMYSPVLGQFFYQDTVTVSNLPQVDAYVHFRIKSFSAYFRLENLNTAQSLGGFHFNNHNLAAPDYPTQGLILRFGIFWGFVN